MTTNPAKLPFPVDKWGFTSAIKKEILKAASTVQGNDEKNELLLNTLVVLVTHIKLRQIKDKELKASRMKFNTAQKQDRAVREMVTGDRTLAAKASVTAGDNSVA